MELSPEIAAWVERLTGGVIISAIHQGRWRDHFFVDVRQPSGQVLKLLVRFPRMPAVVAASEFLSHYTIGHEAAVLRELQGRGLSIPKFYGFNASTPAILMERVGGSADLAGVDDTDRRVIMREYIENLVKLHGLRLDPGRFPATATPDTPRKRAIGSLLDLMERTYETARPGLRPEPLLDFAIRWLEKNAPRTSEVRLIQGDTGPGQFLAEHGHLTALIDWELCHFGDPMVDLGVMRMRNMLYPVGELRPHIDYYAELTGKVIDRETLCFQTVSAMLQSPLGIVASIQVPDASIPSMIPRFGWDVTLRRGLCDALCEALGIDVEPPTFPREPPQERSDLARFLVDYLEVACAPVARGDYDQFIVRGAVGVARALELQQKHGLQIEIDDLDDMEIILGVRPGSREGGMRRLQDLVSLHAESRAKDLLWLFSRLERRREYLWAPMMIAQQARPLERLYPATERYVPKMAEGAAMV